MYYGAGKIAWERTSHVFPRGSENAFIKQPKIETTCWQRQFEQPEVERSDYFGSGKSLALWDENREEKTAGS